MIKHLWVPPRAIYLCTNIYQMNAYLISQFVRTYIIVIDEYP